MTRVLVLMDFSAAALAALRVARAAFPDGALRVLHVVSPGVDPHPGGYSQEEEQLAALGGGEITLGQPAGEALRRARAGECDVVVLGTAGRRGLSRLLLGSVAEAVIRDAPVPVLSVHSPDAEDHLPLPLVSQRRWLSALHDLGPAEDPVPARVLVLMDFSDSARRALDFVRTHLPGAQVDLLHVVDPASITVPFALPGASAPPLRGVSSQLLAERNALWEREARARLAELGGGEVTQGEPAGVALERARSGAYDLLAVGTAARRGLERLIVGSVAARIVRESPVAVLTARAPEGPAT